MLNVNYKISPANKYDVASDALNEVSVENISGSLTLPLKRKNEDVILLGALANQLSMYASGNDPDNHRSYYTGLKLGYQKKLRDSLNVLLMLIPRITSDFEEIDKSDYQWGGVVLFNKVKNESFKWKYGLYVNTEFFGFFVVPLLGIDWKISDKIRFFGNLPASMTGEYKVGQHYRSGLKFVAPTVSYRLTDAIGSSYLHQYTNQLSWYHDLYLTNSIVLQGQIGITAFRYYRLYDKDDHFDVSVSGIGIGESRQPAESGMFRDFKDGFVFQLGLIYRYDLESKK